MFALFMALCYSQGYRGSNYYHRGGQRLPHCKRAKDKTELWVRFPEKFKEKAKQSIP